MTGPEFFQTIMGRHWYEVTAPKIANQLERLNTNIEALVTELRLQRESRTTTDAASKPNEDR